MPRPIISDEKLEAFQALWRRHFGKEIDRESAYELGIKLIEMMRLIYHPITDDEQKAVELRQHDIG